MVQTRLLMLVMAVFAPALGVFSGACEADDESPGPDSCPYAFNAVCEGPPYCKYGTDQTDCATAAGEEEGGDESSEASSSNGPACLKLPCETDDDCCEDLICSNGALGQIMNNPYNYYCSYPDCQVYDGACTTADDCCGPWACTGNLCTGY